MSDRGITDLEELATRCRDSGSKDLIEEAIRCYNSGSYRAAIVITWISVVFDIVQKVSELQMTGDKKASECLTNAAAFLQSGNDSIINAQEFERDILKIAQEDLELISFSEREALSRLKEDRNHCAHPTLTSYDAPYQPTAELARLHIKNAVEYVLQNPPIQGKASLDRIVAKISSRMFPIEKRDAKIMLESMDLKRIRASLFRNLLVVLMKRYLIENPESDERSRIITAIEAIVEMKGHESRKVLCEEFNKIYGRVDESNYAWLLRFVNRFPELLTSTSNGYVNNTIENYVRSCDKKELPVAIFFTKALPELHKIALQRVEEMTNFGLGDVFQYLTSENTLFDEIIKRLGMSQEFRIAEELFDKLILPRPERISIEQLKAILSTVAGNYQIYGAYHMPEKLVVLHERIGELNLALKNEWSELDSALKENKEYGPSGLQALINKSISEGANEPDIEF